MNARKALEEYGEKLIGRSVLTHPYGAWPGGRCLITEIRPDPEAPEIVFQVRGLDGQVCDGSSEIGVFEHEEILLLWMKNQKPSCKRCRPQAP
jgi:hypothetical protein